jgi:hypothetical protein
LIIPAKLGSFAQFLGAGGGGGGGGPPPPPLCYLGLDCQFWAGNLWWNTPPPEQKKIVRDERTTERNSVDGGLLGSSQRLLGMQSAFEPGFGLALGECGSEDIALLGSERRAGVPGLLGRLTMQAPGARGGVGLVARRCEVVAGP